MVANACLRWYDIYVKIYLCETGGKVMNLNMTKRILSLVLTLSLYLLTVTVF